MYEIIKLCTYKRRKGLTNAEKLHYIAVLCSCTECKANFFRGFSKKKHCFPCSSSLFVLLPTKVQMHAQRIHSIM
jgi:hypothetical protein